MSESQGNINLPRLLRVDLSHVLSAWKKDEAMTQWFYRTNTSVKTSVKSDDHGPVSAQELLQLIRDGVINEDTLIRKDDSNWVLSTEVNGLWAAAGRPIAAFECPYCNKPIPKPPVQCGGCHQQVLHAVGHLVPPTAIGSKNANNPVSQVRKWFNPRRD